MNARLEPLARKAACLLIPSLILSCLLIFFSFFTRAAYAQQASESVHATGSNLLRVGDGSTTDQNGNTFDKRYFEEIADARLFFNYFSLGLRYEMDDPSEVGRSYTDREFRRRWLTYRKDQLELTAGDVPALFGRGLAVDCFESRPLNYDSWLDGVFGRTQYNVPSDWLDLDASIAIKGVGGQEDFYPVPLSTSTQLLVQDTIPMHISARAADMELGFFKKRVTLGATFLQAFTTTNIPAGRGIIQTTTRQVNQPDFFADINSGEFEAFAEWTENRNQVNEYLSSPLDTSHTGHALYGSLSYSNSFIGLTFDYKNYSYFLHQPGDPFTNVFSKLPISSPPEVYKDYTWTSITRTTHAVNFDDELGYQLEANITAIPQVVLDLNAAASSSHDKYDPGGAVLDSTSIFPKLNDVGFYPYWEIYGEAEWDFDPNNDLNFLKFAVHRRNEVVAYTPGTGLADERWSTTIAGKFQYETTPTQSLLAIWEHQWAFDGSLGTNDKRRINELITLQYSFNPLITFGGILDKSFFYAESPFATDGTWGQGFISLRLGGSHSLLASYGSERGGLNCTGGICRVVPPFKGLRLTLTSQI